MPDLPVVLKVSGRRCVIVGGGAVALRRAKALLDAGALVNVIAPRIDAQVRALNVEIRQRSYQRGDLDGALLVVVASDDPAVNDTVADDAKAAGVLLNRTDDPDAGDLSIPAHAHHGPVTIAVHTSGVSATAAAAIRGQLSDALDPDWPRLLEVIAPYRILVQRRGADTPRRLDLLQRLAGDEAMGRLKRQGPDALRQYCEQLIAEHPCTTPSPPPR